MSYTDKSGYYIPSRIQRIDYFALCLDTNTYIGYFCRICKSFNLLVETHCKYYLCNKVRPAEYLSLALGQIGRSVSQDYKMADDKVEEARKFFNAEVAVITSLDDFQLAQRLQEMCDIDFEAKSRINAIHHEQRERSAKKTGKEKSWLVNINDSVTVSDAINNVKERKSRMSKGDKLLADLRNLMGDDEANAVMSQVARKVTNGSQTTDSSRELKSNNTVVTPDRPNSNTRESLVADLSSNIREGIGDSTRSVDSLVDAARTAARIGNKILGPFNPDDLFSSDSKSEETITQIIKEDEQNKKPFDPNDLFK